MLFNSYVFIFLFLPLTLAGFFLLARVKPLLAAAWLTAASLFFYGWWNPLYVWLLAASIVFNYAFGVAIGRAVADAARSRAKALLIVSVTANLGVRVVLAHLCRTTRHAVAARLARDGESEGQRQCVGAVRGGLASALHVLL